MIIRLVAFWNTSAVNFPFTVKKNKYEFLDDK